MIYALPVWATTFPIYLIKLKRLQNKAISIISKTSPKDRISQHYCRLQILKLDELYKFEVAELMHQFTHKKKQIYSANILHIPMVFLNTQLVIRLIIIFIFRNFPPTGHNDLLNMLVLKYRTTSPVILNNFPTLNLNIFTNNTS